MPRDTKLSYTIIDERNSNPELANEIRQALALRGYKEVALNADPLINIILSLGNELSFLTLPNDKKMPAKVKTMAWLRENTQNWIDGGYAILYVPSGISPDQKALLTAKPDEDNNYKKELERVRKKLLHAFHDVGTFLEAMNKLPPDCHSGIIYTIRSTQTETGADACVDKIKALLDEYLHCSWAEYMYPDVVIILSLTESDSKWLEAVIAEAANGQYKLLFCPIYLTRAEIHMLEHSGAKAFFSSEDLERIFPKLA